MSETVRGDSLVTLHYRMLLDDGTVLVSTFGAAPATLKLGSGELAPSLERCLAGMSQGEARSYRLEPEAAFGRHDPRLVKHFSRAALPADMQLEERAWVEFPTPDGSRCGAMVRELADAHVLIDFNHPLAGKTISFEVEIIGII